MTEKLSIKILHRMINLRTMFSENLQKWPGYIAMPATELSACSRILRRFYRLNKLFQYEMMKEKPFVRKTPYRQWYDGFREKERENHRNMVMNEMRISSKKFYRILNGEVKLPLYQQQFIANIAKVNPVILFP